MERRVEDFIERIGLLTEEEGFPRIAGRILGLLVVEEEPASLDEMVEKLNVSKGSISTNVRMLERLGIVERVSSQGGRRDYYRLTEDPWENIFEVARKRLTNVLGVVEKGIETLPRERKVGRRRLEEWRDFYSFLLDDLERKVERWRVVSHRNRRRPLGARMDKE
ncbi:MAG: MarR family transcriptional regulator [Thermoanaerobaculia bacterium]